MESDVQFPAASKPEPRLQGNLPCGLPEFPRSNVSSVNKLAEHVELDGFRGLWPTVYCHICQEGAVITQWQDVSLSGLPRLG